MIENITSTMKNLNQRVSSPIFSSFIISWLVCNFRIVIIFFSSLEPRYKIYEIELLIGQDGAHWRLYIIPLLVSLFYSAIYPFLELHVYKLWLNGNRKLINAKTDSDGKTSLSQEQVNALRQNLYDYKEKYLNLLDSNDEEIKELKSRLESVPKTIKEQFSIREAKLIDELASSHRNDLIAKDEKYLLLESKLNEYIEMLKRQAVENNDLKEKIKVYTRKAFTASSLEEQIFSHFINSEDYKISPRELLKNFSNHDKLKAEKIVSDMMNKDFLRLSDDYNGQNIHLTQKGKEHYMSLI
ncbi:hypothetical protein [Shewanella mangrovisoli]|uniref:Uncharacterized protein n=1 Tax=Shewanella mangrovisoli TaxID=2864211 RepID=A0ABV4VJM2_9GAMM